MLKVATVFSGIGSFEHALNKLNIPHEIIFACDNGEIELNLSEEEIKKRITINKMEHQQTKLFIDNLYKDTGKINYVQNTYMSNYNVEEKDYYQDIRFLDGRYYENNIDILVGGSPCQSFSISGKQAGLEDTRGTLFYDFARIVNETKPKVFIFENVPGMLSHDNGNTWEVISAVFNALNYSWKLFILNSKDFGIPQNRRRIFVVGFHNKTEIKPNLTVKKIKLDKTVEDFLEDYVNDEYYHGEKGFKWITKPLSLKKRVSINSEISRTQAANQQFNWCGDMRFEPKSERKFNERVYIGKYKGIEGVARKLTPRECLRLMGFNDSFKIVVPDTKMYRQSGNSIVVNILESLLESIIETGVFNE